MDFLRRFASRVDDWLDRRRMEDRASEVQDEPVTAVAYRGYGDGKRIWLRGSVVEVSKLEKPPVGGGLLEDLAVTINRFTAEEIMGATVLVRHGDIAVACTTDSDGFFYADLEAEAEEGWQEAKVTLTDFPGRSQANLSVMGEFLVPHSGATLGIISDIDDTVIRTGISKPLQNIRTIVESDPESRVAFPGLASLYQALQHGGGHAAVNPIFYVSSGSWKLYDLIVRFKALNGIPRGPMFMDDWGLDETRWFKSSHGAHKIRSIDTIMETYPDLDFILVGDSGQHDAEIYTEMVRKHGARIKAIWIRDVSDAARDEEVATVTHEAAKAGVAVYAEENLADAAADAARRGWITEDDLAVVQREIAAATAQG